MEGASSWDNPDRSIAMKLQASGSNNSRRAARGFSSCRAVALACILVPLSFLALDEQLYPAVLPCNGDLMSYFTGTSPESTTEDAVLDSASLRDIRRFVSNYQLIKERLPHYYGGFTPSGDIMYFVELNNLDFSIVDRGLVTVRDLEMHLQLVRQIVWDCLISLDVQPRMHIFADLRGLSASSMGAFWSTRFTVLRHILRSLRDKTLTKRDHQVSVAVISDSPFVRALVEIKKHRFPPNTTVHVYSSLSDMYKNHERGVWKPSVIPRRYGGTADTILEEEGFEFLIKMFVEEILSQDYTALEQCAAVRAGMDDTLGPNKSSGHKGNLRNVD